MHSLGRRRSPVVLAVLLLVLGLYGAAQTPRWPHTITNAQGQITLYQPQVDDWKNFQVVDARIAFAVTPTGGKQQVGVATVQMQTVANMDTHTVVLSNPQITSLYFPSLSAAATPAMDQLVRSFLNPSATMTISVDQIAASIKKKAPPAIFSVNHRPP